MSLLEIDAIDAYYGESHIIRDLSMSVEEGEITALLGRNGAGKTSTLRCIAGATPPEVRSGAIQFRRNGHHRRSAGGRRRPRHLAGARGAAHLPEPLRRREPPPRGGRQQQVEHLAADARFGDEGMSTAEIYEYFPRLDERRTQQAGTLSGGEQQMLAIARALLRTPTCCCSTSRRGARAADHRVCRKRHRTISDDGTTILLVEQNVSQR
ncbi:ABC transporter ATP-binding protein [Haloferax sp. wsp5]|nr:ABC transporter ATP-binding protein [Haloferax sp. wsp5]